MPIQPSHHPNADTLKSLIRTEVLRYEKAIYSDYPFKEARKIKKNIKKLKMMLAQQEQECTHS
jgi:hypothetical protein